MQRRWKKLENDGFTLVELIVVVLIIGVISATAVLSLSSINRAKANGCTNRLVKLLDQTRSDAMSRVDGSVKLVISKRENAYYGTLYISDGTIKDEVELGDASLTIEFYEDSDTSSRLVCRVDESSSFTIKYNKGNGSLHFDSSGSALDSTLPFDRIVITGSNTRTIRIYEETGRYRLQ